MALIKAKEVRALNREDRHKKLAEFRQELMHERGVAAMGGSPPSPGKIRQLRTAIARILTIENQERAGMVFYRKNETVKAPSPAAAKPAARKPAAKATQKPAAKPVRKPVPKAKSKAHAKPVHKASHAHKPAAKPAHKPAHKPAARHTKKKEE